MVEGANEGASWKVWMKWGEAEHPIKGGNGGWRGGGG